MRGWMFDLDADDAAGVGLRMIGTTIRSARLRLAWSQRQLAWKAGLTQGTISKLERGHLRGMRLRTLARLLGVLRADLAIMASGPAPPPASILGDPAQPEPTRRWPG